MYISGHRFLPYILVVIQFAVGGVLVYWSIIVQKAETAAIIFVIAGFVMALTGIISMRIGNFRILPIPKAGAILTTRGMYKYIRHPMYSGVLLITFGCSINAGHVLGYGLWVMLLADLLLKLQLEERLLVKQFPEYHAYILRTKRLVPFVW